MHTTRLIASLFLVLASFSCRKKDTAEAPSVRTDSVSQVTLNSANLTMTVTADGGSPVTERGVFFGNAPFRREAARASPRARASGRLPCR